MTDLSTTPRPASGPGQRPGGSTPPWYVAIVAVILLTILAILVVLLLRDGDDQTVDTALPSTTAVDTTAPSATTGDTTDPTTAASTTSTTIETTTSVTTTPTSVTSATTSPPPSFVPAVWPWLDSSTRYDDPVEAATEFAVDFLGFRAPVVGPFLEGDGRSGEVEIRPTEDGPGTVLFVRQVTSDDTWWIVGAATENIEITAPDVLEEITSPLVVEGRALAFEGTVDLELRADGRPTPLVTGFVTGGGAEMDSFEGSFPFELPDEAGGSVVLRTMSAENGQVWEAAVVRIRFPLPG